MKAGKVPMYWTGVPPPPVVTASLGAPDSSFRPFARISRIFSATMSSASSHEIGTKPGSCSRPFCGLVRFMGCLMRLGL
jgi:hypothetical protein